MNMTFYRSNGRGNAKNCIYPKKCVVDNEDDCLEVMAFDHVCGNLRISAGAERISFPPMWKSWTATMTIPMIRQIGFTRSDLERLIGKDVAFFAVPSRNNGKSKDGKAARPRFHVYFPHDPIIDREAWRGTETGNPAEIPLFSTPML